MRISAVNGTAFVDFGAANVLTSKLGNLLVIKDSLGHSIQGWIKAAGSGETLGSEEVDTWVNSTARPYETWTPGAGVLITQAVNSTLSGVCYKVLSTAPTSKLFKCVNSITINSGVLTSFGFGNGGEDFVIGGYGEITRNATSYITIPLNYANFGLRANSGVAVDFALTDFSLKQVLTPSATGVTIVNSKGGSTYNFSAKDSAFNYNDASGYTYLIYKTPAVLIANGTFTAANARNSFDATTAFCEASGLDLSPYAGTDAGSTPYLIELEDASGDVAWGFGGAVGGGEALDVEKVVNGDFALWTGDNPNSWNVAEVGDATSKITENPAGQCQLIRASSLCSMAQNVLTAKALYKVTGDINSISGNLLIGTTGEGVGPKNFSSTGSFSFYYTSPDITLYAYCLNPCNATIDNISAKQVTDCAATGLHIVTARNGTDRGWKTIGATFGYNDAMKYRIYYLGS
jgi:hypothetical protein